MRDNLPRFYHAGQRDSEQKLQGGKMPDILILALIIFVLTWILYAAIVKKQIIFDFQKGLKYKKGRLTKQLEPGMHRYISRKCFIQVFDVRPKLLTITGQEILSSDGVALRISVVAQCQLVDLIKAVSLATPHEEMLHVFIQLALRDVVSSLSVENLLAKKGEIDVKVLEKTITQAESLGLKLSFVKVKDISFPGELKTAFSQVARARQEALATLEKARGEQAALRALANSANAIKKNPSLLYLRMLQSTGNTLVMNVGAEGVVPVKKK